jgi:hypothetical protein
MSKSSNGGGKSGGGGTPMTGEAASRIQSAGDRDPSSPTAESGFGPRAQSAAASNEAES